MLFPWFCKDTSRSSIFSMFWLVAMAEGSGGVSGSCWDRSAGTAGCASPCACPACPMAISSSGSAAGPGGSSCPQSGDRGTSQGLGTGQELPQQSTQLEHGPPPAVHPVRAATTRCEQHLHLSLLGLTGTHRTVHTEKGSTAHRTDHGGWLQRGDKEKCRFVQLTDTFLDAAASKTLTFLQ